MATEIKKYLDTTAIGTLVEQIKAEDAKALAAAKKYTDDAGKLYDVAGAAATAEQNAKDYTDELANGQVKTNKEDIAKLNGDVNTDGSVAKAIATAKATIDADIDAVEAKANKNAEDIAAINNETTGILAQAKKYTDDEVSAVQDEVDALETYVGVIPETATATDIVGYVQEKTAGIATEGAMTELGNRVGTVEGKVAAIEGDYLKKADKEELAGDIADVQTAVDTEKGRAKGVEEGLAARIKAVEDDYLVEADKTELANAVAAETERATGVEGGLDTRLKAVEDDYLTSTDKEALQTQINTIMSNPDAEGAINSINEFTQYVKDHGTIADGFRTDIDKNKEDIAKNAKAIADHETLSGQTYATKTELANEKKALQEEIDADVKVVADDLTELSGVVTGLGNTKADSTALTQAVEALEGADEELSGRIATLEGKFGGADGSVEDQIAEAQQAAIDAAAADATSKANAAEAAAKGHADSLNTAMNTRVEALEAIDHDHSNKAVVDGITADKVTGWDNASAKAHEHANAAELAKIADGDVAKWNASEQNAKTYADGLNTAMTTKVDGIGTRVGTLETTIVDKAESDDLDAAVERIAKNETDIASLTSSVGAFTPITSEEVNALFA